jgi:histidinol-phosphate phosphatase family protein
VMDFEFVILAGGLGKRLRERTGNLPKVLAEVDNRALLEHQLRLLQKYDIKKGYLVLGYKSECIINFCDELHLDDLEINYIIEDKPLGTAGGVLQNLDKFHKPFILFYGDTMVNVDLPRFYSWHNDKKADVSLFLHPNNHPHDSDIVKVDENCLVTDFHNYPHPGGKWFKNLVNAGLYIINPNSLKEYSYEGDSVDFIKDIFSSILIQNKKIYGYISSEYIKDCGTPERLDQVNDNYKNGLVSHLPHRDKNKIVFLDRDGTINRLVDHLAEVEQFELLPDSGKAISLFNKSNYKVSVITNQPVIARGDCSYRELQSIHDKMEWELGLEGAFLDNIEFCPHHPDKGFPGEVLSLKYACDCRKPKSNLLDRTVEKFSICMQSSWFIGDSTTDLMTAERYGVSSVLLRTGLGGKDQKYNVEPNFTFENLYEASLFITQKYEEIKTKVVSILDDYPKTKVLFVTGQSKAGKSTLANVIKKNRTCDEFKCHVISTDFWLKTRDARGQDLLSKHDMDALRLFLQSIDEQNDTISFNLPFYDKHSRRSIKSSRAINISPGDTIVVEGLVAFEFAELFPGSPKIFVTLNEDKRKKNIKSEYSHRDYDEQDIESLYERRRKNEFVHIDRYKHYDDVITFQNDFK